MTQQQQDQHPASVFIGKAIDAGKAYKKQIPFQEIADSKQSLIENEILSILLEGSEYAALFTMLSTMQIKMVESITAPDGTQVPIDVMAADSDYVYVNPFTAHALNMPQIVGVLHHELVHLRGRHTTRVGRLVEHAKKTGDKLYLTKLNQWQNIFLDVTCDSEVVNANSNRADIQMIHDHLDMCIKAVRGVDNFDDWQDRMKLGNLREDEVMLLDSFIKFLCAQSDDEDENQPDEQPGFGGVIVTEEDIEAADAKLIASIQAAARMAGVDPGEWNLNLPKPDTRPLLIDIIEQARDEGNTKYSFMKTDPEYMAQGIILPTKCLSDNRPVAVMLDVSGSVVYSPADFSVLLGQLQQLNMTTPVCIIPYDHDVKPEIWCEDEDALAALDRRGTRGGGGTSFDAPVIRLNELAVEHRFSAWVMLTDGYARYTRGLADEQITWISTGACTKQNDPDGEHYIARLR